MTEPKKTRTSLKGVLTERKPRTRQKPRQVPFPTPAVTSKVAECPARSDPHGLYLVQREGEERGAVLADAMLGPNIRHGHVATIFANKMLNEESGAVSLMDAAAVVAQRAAEAVNGDLSFASAMLASQAISLDMMFGEFARKAAENVERHVDAADRYARLALKAQSNARTTLEALTKLHLPREQTVRHVHVNAGGQAVVAEEFHTHHAGGLENERADQCHEPRAKAASASPALPSPNALGNAVPMSGSKRKATLQTARRK